MRRNVYEMNYFRLCKLLGQKPSDLALERAYRFRAKGFMDLVVERISDCAITGAPVLSLCHYFEHEGDLCKDPEMTVRIFEPRAVMSHGMVDVLTFEQSIPPIYQQVYPEPGKVRPQLKKELNAFFGLWLRNLTDQGHRLVSAGN